MRIEKLLSEKLSEIFSINFNVDADALIRPATDTRFGDYQANGLLPLAKRLGKTARELAPSVLDPICDLQMVAEATVAGPGFINLRLDADWLAKELLGTQADPEIGISKTQNPEHIVVDFSGPNVAKQMHVGHLRSTILGAAIIRLLRCVGHEVLGDNHLGDWGTQFGLLIAGLREFRDDEDLNDLNIEELEALYKQANDRGKNDTEFAAQARAELAKLQAGDSENLKIWQRFVEITRTELDRIYDRLGVSFDLWLGKAPTILCLLGWSMT
ncbi:MAG: arginine--tRNA ligase [Myxococcales bacterium]|nr:MAG: arginine--tRNA ligase [Myxococcales bacterium]